MSIPDEAVEAAHRAWREQNTEPGTIFEYNLRAALEAAAPYIIAGYIREMNLKAIAYELETPLRSKSETA